MCTAFDDTKKIVINGVTFDIDVENIVFEWKYNNTGSKKTLNRFDMLDLED